MTLVMKAALALQKAGKAPAFFAIVHQDDAIKVILDYTKSISQRYIDPEYHAKEILTQYPDNTSTPKPNVVETLVEKDSVVEVDKEEVIEDKTTEVKTEQKFDKHKRR